MPILNYTTQVAAEKSIQELQVRLVRVGARAILTEYDTDGVVSAVSFRLKYGHKDLMFNIPAQIDNVLSTLRSDRNVPKRFKTKEQAARVCWRIIKDWVAAQAAIVEAEQADVAEVFLPYVQSPRTGQTLYRELIANDFNLLTAQSSA